jgi:hypothetical protein
VSIAATLFAFITRAAFVATGPMVRLPAIAARIASLGRQSLPRFSASSIGRRTMCKPGHRQGVPRYRRPGQITLDVGRLLHGSIKIWPKSEPNLEAVAACTLCDESSVCTGACDDEEDG